MTAPVALASLRVTVLVSLVVALVNAVMGTLIAWVLVRDDFPGKRIVNALIDLPFALPTIVASIVLCRCTAEQPVNFHLNATKWGLMVALAFVTLPFVVRSVQPVLIEADREVEEAAASLGAGSWTTFRRVVLPTLGPAVVGGTGLAFARRSASTARSCSSATTSRARPRWPRSTSSSRSRSTGRSTRRRYRSLCSRSPSSRCSSCGSTSATRSSEGDRPMRTSTTARLALRTVALAYLLVLLAVPSP